MFFILFSTKLHAGTDFWGFNLIDKILFFPAPFSFGLFSSKWLWKATPLFVCLFIKTTPMCQSLLPPFANKYSTRLKVTL